MVRLQRAVSRILSCGVALHLCVDCSPRRAAARPFDSDPMEEVVRAERRKILDFNVLLEHLPARTTTKSGKPGDPVNLIFIGRGELIRKALRKAGFTTVPTNPFKATIEAAFGLFRGHILLPKFPSVKKQWLLGRSQDLSYARVVSPLFNRHHFRLWKFPSAAPWGEEVWIGMANQDVHIRLRDLSHKIDPRIDEEREYIHYRLLRTRRVRQSWYVEIPNAVKSGRNSSGYPYHTDGKALVIELH